MKRGIIETKIYLDSGIRLEVTYHNREDQNRPIHTDNILISHADMKVIEGEINTLLDKYHKDQKY